VGESSFDRWASVLVNYSTEVKPEDQVAISGGVAAEPLLRAIYREVLRKGAHAVLMPSFSEAQADLFNNASDEQLAFISPLERWLREDATVTIDVEASTNTRALSALDPSRQAIWSRARTELRKSAVERAARGERRWSLTIFPTPAYAQDADMATDEFASFLRSGLYAGSARSGCRLARAFGAASPHDRLAPATR
jgi:aminopeptidase